MFLPKPRTLKLTPTERGVNPKYHLLPRSVVGPGGRCNPLFLAESLSIMLLIAPRQPTEDRRGSPRAKLQTAATLAFPQGMEADSSPAVVQDLSPLGVKLEVAAAPLLGAPVAIQIDSPLRQPISLGARVVWVEPSSSGPCRVGCELSSELSRRDFAALREAARPTAD